MNRVDRLISHWKIIVYIWIGSVFFWLIAAAVIGKYVQTNETDTGTVVFIFLMSIVTVVVIIAGYVIVWLTSTVIKMLDEKRKEELREELEHETDPGRNTISGQQERRYQE